MSFHWGGCWPRGHQILWLVAWVGGCTGLQHSLCGLGHNNEIKVHLLLVPVLCVGRHPSRGTLGWWRAQAEAETAGEALVPGEDLSEQQVQARCRDSCALPGSCVCRDKLPHMQWLQATPASSSSSGGQFRMVSLAGNRGAGGAALPPRL